MLLIGLLHPVYCLVLQETAINIAYSSHLIDDDMDVIIIKVSSLVSSTLITGYLSHTPTPPTPYFSHISTPPTCNSPTPHFSHTPTPPTCNSPNSTSPTCNSPTPTPSHPKSVLVGLFQQPCVPMLEYILSR